MFSVAAWQAVSTQPQIDFDFSSPFAYPTQSSTSPDAATDNAQVSHTAIGQRCTDENMPSPTPHPVTRFPVALGITQANRAAQDTGNTSAKALGRAHAQSAWSSPSHRSKSA